MTRESVADLTRRLAASSDTPAPQELQAAKRLRDISSQSPQLVYPYFDLFAELLRHENAILRWNAMLTLGNLARVDADSRLDLILDDYLAPIHGPRLIDAANSIRGAAAIAAAKPSLADAIIRSILKAGHARYATAECRNVAIGHAISALERLFPSAPEERTIRLFVSRQTANARAATRTKAERLLRKWQRK